LDEWAISSKLLRLQAHFMGYGPQCFAWGVIVAQFLEAGGQSTVDDEGEKREMPSFVYAIVFGEVLIFWCFGLVQLIVSLRPPAKYYQGEIAYMYLSLFAKGLQWVNKKVANKYLYGAVGAEMLASLRVHKLGRKYGLMTTDSAQKDWAHRWPVQDLFSVDILNVPSMAAGWNAWGSSDSRDVAASGYRPPTWQDEVLEFAGVEQIGAIFKGRVRKDGNWAPSHHIVQSGHSCLSWGTPADHPTREGEQHEVYLQVDGEAIQAMEAGSVEVAFKEYVWTIVNAEIGEKYPFYDSIFPPPLTDRLRDESGELRLSQFA